MMYDELIKQMRACCNGEPCEEANCGFNPKSDLDCIEQLLTRAADAIEDLQDKVNRAVRFYDSVETAELMRGLNECLPNILDPAWQKAHMEMGFYSPVGEVYKAIGIYDESPESEGE